MKQVIVELDGAIRLMYADCAPATIKVGTDFNIKGIRGNSWQRVRCTKVYPNPAADSLNMDTYGKKMRQTVYQVT